LGQHQQQPNQAEENKVFGLDDAILFPLIGSAVGGLLNKKDPLAGAAMGAVGGMAAPAMGGLLSQAPAAGSGLAMGGGTGLTAGGGMGMTVPATVVTPSPGIMESVKSAAEIAKPVGNIFSAANAAQGLLAPKQQPIQASPVMQNSGSPALTGLTQQIGAMEQQRMQDDAQQRRARRASLLGG
jgi:hypothetical protein